ncbi:alpha/beta hydrolase [Cupriavidus sp. SK-4]|uniref:alpha/beta hydrolase n=1 Tax=Cupriavidus sp. SK-4 TaxID=574750 RepID=UPI003510C6DB
MTRLDRAREFGQTWGSRFVELGEVGHLNPASGHGEWPRAEESIRGLMTERWPGATGGEKRNRPWMI